MEYGCAVRRIALHGQIEKPAERNTVVDLAFLLVLFSLFTRATALCGTRRGYHSRDGLSYNSPLCMPFLL